MRPVFLFLRLLFLGTAIYSGRVTTNSQKKAPVPCSPSWRCFFISLPPAPYFFLHTHIYRVMFLKKWHLPKKGWNCKLLLTLGSLRSKKVHAIHRPTLALVSTLYGWVFPLAYYKLPGSKGFFLMPLEPHFAGGHLLNKE